MNYSMYQFENGVFVNVNFIFLEQITLYLCCVDDLVFFEQMCDYFSDVKENPRAQKICKAMGWGLLHVLNFSIKPENAKKIIFDLIDEDFEYWCKILQFYQKEATNPIIS